MIQIMIITELREALRMIENKSKQADLLYQNYLHMKSISPKKEKLLEILQEGITFYNQGQFEKAYELFSEAINFEADADAFHNRGTTCMDLGNLIHAIHDFTAAIIFCPTYGPPYFNRALCVSQILADNNALDDIQNKDLKDFAKADLQKAIELGLSDANEYLKMLGD